LLPTSSMGRKPFAVDVDEPDGFEELCATPDELASIEEARITLGEVELEVEVSCEAVEAKAAVLGVAVEVEVEPLWVAVVGVAVEADAVELSCVEDDLD
jgi:hypothetical protein